MRTGRLICMGDTAFRLEGKPGRESLGRDSGVPGAESRSLFLALVLSRS